MSMTPETAAALAKHANNVFSKIQVVRFRVTPTSIAPFETVAIDWAVRGPTAEFRLLLSYVGLISPQGTTTVMPRESETLLTLEAEVSGFRKTLAKKRVTVDISQCKSATATSAVIEATILQNLQTQFAGDQIYLRDTPVRVSIDARQLHINLNLMISVPKWFDAALDIDMDFGFNVAERTVQGSKEHYVSGSMLKSQVDVSWEWWENTLAAIGGALLPGLGSGTSAIVQAAVEATLKGCVDAMLGPQIAQKLQEGLIYYSTLEIIPLSDDPVYDLRKNFDLFDIHLTSEQIELLWCKKLNHK